MKDKRIFTTGAFLQPKRVNDTWVWIVDSFEDDSFCDGEVCNPQEFAKNSEELLADTIAEQ